MWPGFYGVIIVLIGICLCVHYMHITNYIPATLPKSMKTRITLFSHNGGQGYLLLLLLEVLMLVLLLLLYTPVRGLLLSLLLMVLV